MAAKNQPTSENLNDFLKQKMELLSKSSQAFRKATHWLLFQIRYDFELSIKSAERLRRKENSI